MGLESMRTGKTATRIACKVLPIPHIRNATEAVRSHSRGSQRVLELYSPSILKLVSAPMSLPSYPRGAINMCSWLVVRVNIV